MCDAGLIAVGCYPTAVAASTDRRPLYVANGKGNGSGANPDGRYIGNIISGSVSVIPIPDSAGLQRYTSQVYALSPFSNARLRPATRSSDRPPELKHVVYIIRENRTYDQVLDRKSTRLNSSHLVISYAVFCLKKKK